MPVGKIQKIMIKGIILTITFLILSFLLTPFLGYNLAISFQEGVLTEISGQLVYLVNIDGEIKAGTYQFLKRAIRITEKEKAEYLVIKIDTPGGLLKATKDITDLILATPVKTIVFVHKEGGWAYSAGTFILMAGDYAIVHPEASIGAAQPREMAIEGVKEIDPKIIEGMASWMKSLAERNQRNSEVAEKFIRENLTLTGKEAKELGIIDETAKDLNEFFSKLKIYQPKIKEIFPTPIEKFFDLLSHPYLISLFLTLGGLGLIFAFRTGEFELAPLGLMFLLVGLWGMGIIQFSVFGLALILLGLFLLVLEIFQPGFGVFGALGTISLLLGIFTLEAEPFFSPKIFEAITMVVIGATITIAILFVIIGRGVVKTLKEKPKTGPEALIGLKVEVIKELNPLGQVKTREEIWSAESINGRTIHKGAKVKIIEVKGNTLFVEKLEE